MTRATRQRFTVLHTWVGVIAGWALFIAFFAGALSVFHAQIQVWQNPAWRAQPLEQVDAGQRLIEQVLARHPAARAHIGITVPGHEYRSMTAYWPEADGYHNTTLAKLAGDRRAGHSALADFIFALHDSLGLGTFGLYFMGVISLLYGVALISGMVIHFKHLLPDLLALRAGHNLKRLWQDAHNVIGVLSLPFHVIFAVTGAMLCLFALSFAVLGTFSFGEGFMGAYTQATQVAPQVRAAGTPARPLSPAALAARARQVAAAHGVADFEPNYIYYTHYGDANGTVTVRGDAARTIGTMSEIGMNAATGKVLSLSLPGARDANHVTYAALFALHFGSFGGRTVQWLYFALGLAGAFLFYSGNLLWIETRRKRRQVTQPRRVYAMARFTVASCIGSCLAMAATFIATLLAPYGTDNVALAEKLTCLAAFLVACAWSSWRPPSRAAVELLAASALVSGGIAVLDLILHGAQWWSLLRQGALTVPAVDAMALALAAAFAWLAWRTQRRASHGDIHSVWHHPPTLNDQGEGREPTSHA
ncbi:PepSY-associated TM helix domain-containing protein [Oleiagrimonas sp. C23AA]|uniref:PepSY-associated TM helix domain-containing protein n=1 Tax=Oleiagrimonas sp. C23AA TaxID=2719047 RepID=UPI001F101927|nr:PepSY-associated TM helix domain-containing protein [Oleiagrimonas sp. C23AA]